MIDENLEKPLVIQEPVQAIKKQNLNLRKLSFSWQQISLGGILLLSACLNLLLLNPASYTNEYYASAVRSMLVNWHNFLYNAYDPGGFITVDKPPVALWFQTASAWLFGYNGVSILLPSALAGVGSVLLVYLLVKRGFGPLAGLASAFVLAITPVFVVMSRHNNPESLLIFFMLLGAWGISRATDKGRFSWLIFAVAMMGVAFNVKMLEAFIVLPAFYLTYLLFASTKWWKRIVHLGLATVVLVIISLSWAVIVDATPANQRPYIGSSSDNTVMNLIFNYNGLNRIEGQNQGGGFNRNGNQPGGFPPNGNSAPQGGFQQSGGFQPPNRGPQNGNTRPGGFGGGGMNGVIAGQAGPLRMFDQTLAGEAGWLLPMALAGIVLAAIQNWRRYPTWQERKKRYQVLLLASGWLLTFMLVFSMAEGLFHSYYLVMLAPGVAALSGISIEALWYSYCQGGWQRWLLPLALLVTAVFQLNILSLYSDWNRTLALIMVVIELVSASGLLGLPRLSKSLASEWSGGVAAAGFLGLCLAPAAWAISAIVKKSYTNETLPTAVPAGTNTNSGFTRNAINGLLDNLLHNWNSWLTLLVVGLLALVGLALALRFMLHQTRGKRRFSQWLTVTSGAVVVILGVSLTLTSLPEVASASSGSTNPVSSGMIGNPQMMLSNSDKLITFLEANRDGRTYLLATTSSQNASPIIIKTGQPVMALGGFQGSDQVVNAATFSHMVQDNVIRYVLLDSGGGGFGRMGTGSGQSATSWIQQNCKVVDVTLWSDTSGNTSTASTNQNNFGGRNGFQSSSSGQLYDCALQG
ncbi:MAG TPA: glycosyltransferase family 39 protein [Chloroflexia bacterium]|nr:glycosyltransferase family 39 protein [Chloroflexia bacterium]